MIRCWIRLRPSNQSQSPGRQQVEGSLGDVLKPELPWEAQPVVKVSVSVGGDVSQSADFPLEGCHCKFGCLLKKYMYVSSGFISFSTTPVNDRRSHRLLLLLVVVCLRKNCTEMQREAATDVSDEFGAGRASVFLCLSARPFDNWNRRLPPGDKLHILN